MTLVELLNPEHAHVVLDHGPHVARYVEAYVATGQEFGAIQRHCPLEGGEFCRERCPLACAKRIHKENA